jgi:hypothetical protein
MRSNKAFPNKYLKPADLGGKAMSVTMKELEEQTLNGEKKYVLLFKNEDKGLVLNRTNWDLIAEQHGDESDDWPGKQIILAPDRTMFQGKRVDCIRVRPADETPKAAATRKSPSAPPPPEESEDPSEGLSDVDPDDPLNF